jgi:hypothetical protein
MIPGGRDHIGRRIGVGEIGEIFRRKQIGTGKLGIHHPTGGVLSIHTDLVKCLRPEDIGKIDQDIIASNSVELGRQGILLQGLCVRTGNNCKKEQQHELHDPRSTPEVVAAIKAGRKPHGQHVITAFQEPRREFRIRSALDRVDLDRFHLDA